MKARKLVSATVASLGLVAGLSGFAGATSGTISHTGADSYNVIRSHKSNTVKVRNNNDVNVTNTNSQSAYSGDVGAWKNTTVGDISTGDAANMNTTHISATVNNAASGSTWANTTTPTGGSGATGTIHDTGYDSTNIVKSVDTTKVNINNENNLTVDNSNCQTATTGSVNVSKNTTVGDISTGDATNTNNTTVDLSVSN
jgi:hypothetical protein